MSTEEIEMSNEKIEALITNEPSGSITSDFFDEELRKLKEFEEKFMKMIKNESIDAPFPLLFDVSTHYCDELKPEEPINFAVDRDEEEIDVVNGTLDEVNNLLRPETNETTEQSTEVDRTDPAVENGEEEIDVVNLPANEAILNLASGSTTEILNITPKRKETNTHKRARNEMTSQNTLHEIETAEEEEIDVVNNYETPKRRTEVTLPDFEMLSRALSIRNKRRLRSESNEDVIEITDSPVAPTVISGVIIVDDDDHSTPEKGSTWGNCPVCLEDLAKCEIMSTICGHVYCASCIKTVIKTTKKCPKCRKNLTLKSIHPLFFN